MAVSDATIKAGVSGGSVSAPTATWNVSPTSFMFGALFVAFLFYITVTGDLSKWLGLLGLAKAGVSSTGTPATATSTAAQSAITAGGAISGLPAPLTTLAQPTTQPTPSTLPSTPWWR